MGRIISIGLVSMAVLSHASSLIMRNSALMSKMISQFQGKDKPSRPEADPPPDQGNIVTLMQHVLCKNFPTVPCEYITKDLTLRHLIEKSIQQLKYKKVSLERSTLPPSYQLTLFPVMNSADLSNFLQVSETGYFKQNKKKPRKRQQRKKSSTKNHWSHEQAQGKGRKQLRKFYPHKIKYKHERQDNDYSDEKLSMSVEVPNEHTATPPSVKKRFDYRENPVDPPVWRIDYMKHGEPSFNMFGFEADNLEGKIMKTGPSVIVDEHVLEQVARKDVLHPDVYIKKNYLKKKSLQGSPDGYDY